MAFALHITAVDSENEVRVVELEGHPFFLATLFQPERLAFKGVAHPLLRAFLQTMVEARGGNVLNFVVIAAHKPGGRGRFDAAGAS